MRRMLLGVALVTAVVGTIAVVACGNNANDVAGCRELEDIRCERAAQCGIDLSYPLHAGTSAADGVAACKEFYEDACLHGFVTSITITTGDLSGCASQLTTGNCNWVINPQLAPQCSWLIPPDAGVDAGVDVSIPDSSVPDTYVATADTGETFDSGTTACYSGCNTTCEGDTTCIETCEEECNMQ